MKFKKNFLLYDTESPMVISGLRLGLPAITTRGFKEEKFNNRLLKEENFETSSITRQLKLKANDG